MEKTFVICVTLRVLEVICKTLFFRQEAQNSNQSLHTWQKLKPDIKTGLTGYKSSCYITDFTIPPC